MQLSLATSLSPAPLPTLSSNTCITKNTRSGHQLSSSHPLHQPHKYVTNRLAVVISYPSTPPLSHPLDQPHYRHSKYATQNTGSCHHRSYPSSHPFHRPHYGHSQVTRMEPKRLVVIFIYPSSHPFHTPFTSPTTNTLKVCHQKDWPPSPATHVCNQKVWLSPSSHVSLVHTPFTPPSLPPSHPLHQPHYRHSHSM